MKTQDEILIELRQHIILKYNSQRQAAIAWGVSPVFVNSVLKGTKLPTVQMLAEIGYERVLMYRKKESIHVTKI